MMFYWIDSVNFNENWISELLVNSDIGKSTVFPFLIDSKRFSKSRSAVRVGATPWMTAVTEDEPTLGFPLSDDLLSDMDIEVYVTGPITPTRPSMTREYTGPPRYCSVAERIAESLESSFLTITNLLSSFVFMDPKICC